MAVLISVFLLLRMFFVYLNSRSEYQDIARIAVSTPLPTQLAAINPTTEEETPITTEIPKECVVPINVDWINLRAMNKQIVAWLYCEGTDINYPIVQTKNNTYYLTHNAKRKEDQAGALFLDYRNMIGKELENLIVYGHRMKDGSMFGLLNKFADKSYCDKHKEFYLLTPEETYKIEVIACRTVGSHSKYFPSSFTSTDTEKMYTDKAFSQSYWQAAPEKKPDGAILLTLATCSKYDFKEDARLIVHGWAVPID